MSFISGQKKNANMNNPTNADQRFTIMKQNCHREFLEKYNILRQGYFYPEMSYSVNIAWEKFYSETMQSKIQITYNLEGCHHTIYNNKLSPLVLLGKVKELIREQSSINDINYIHIFKGNRECSRSFREYLSEELDDNKSLHSYGYSGRASLYVYLWDPKNPPQEPSPEQAPSLEQAPSPEPAPEPVQSVESSVIQAIPLSESENEEIDRLKRRISELEERLKEIEYKLG